MKYREWIELYKKNELQGKEREQLEREIERHEAISEYLFDREEEEIFLPGGELPEGDEKADEFTRQIKRTIRKAFIKLGVTVGAVTLAIVFFIIYVLPGLVSALYYNPAKEKGKNEYGGETNQMSLDMAVYSELYLPGYYRYNVQAEPKGYGNYDIVICQNVSYTGQMTNAAGKVEQGKLKLYDVNQLQPVTGNAFGWFQIASEKGERLSDKVKEESHFFCAAGDREQATEALEYLDENAWYMAYVTLDQMMDYESFVDYIDSHENLAQVWCAPCTSDPGGEAGVFIPGNLGFNLDMGVYGIGMSWDEERYPDLILWNDYENGGKDTAEKIREEAFAAEHFAVMLEYMDDQEQFREMMQIEGADLKEQAGYIRENGLTVYGFAAMMKKEDMIRLNGEEQVYEIYAQEIR